MSRRRKNHGGAHENHERWLITYSDLITLLMIFFVIMYAMSKVDQTKFDALSISLNKALHPNNQVQMDNTGTSALMTKSPDSDTVKKTDPSHGKPENNSQANTANTQDAKQQIEQQQLEDLKKKIEAYIQQNNLAGKINVLDTDRGVQITLNDAALFDSGSATLKESALHVLGGMAPFFAIVPNKIAVEGHTDDVPIASGKFPSNWELSSTRAINVVHFFESAGVPHAQLRAIGFADTMPLEQNDSDEHRAANRRVNLIVERQYKRASISPLDKNNVINTNQ